MEGLPDVAGSALTDGVREPAAHILDGQPGPLSVWFLVLAARKGKLQCARTFQASTDIAFAHVPSAKAVHLAKPRFTGRGHRPHLTGGRKEHVAIDNVPRESRLFCSPRVPVPWSRHWQGPECKYF